MPRLFMRDGDNGIIYSPNCFRGKLLNLAFRTELNHASANIALNDLMISPIKFTPFVIKL